MLCKHSDLEWKVEWLKILLLFLKGEGGSWEAIQRSPFFSRFFVQSNPASPRFRPSPTKLIFSRLLYGVTNLEFTQFYIGDPVSTSALWPLLRRHVPQVKRFQLHPLRTFVASVGVYLVYWGNSRYMMLSHSAAPVSLSLLSNVVNKCKQLASWLVRLDDFYYVLVVNDYENHSLPACTRLLAIFHNSCRKSHQKGRVIGRRCGTCPVP